MEGRRPALSCVAARVPRRKVSVQKVEKTLICLGIALVVGLLMSRLAKLVHLPAVTAYLVGGLLIGPFCLGALNIPYIGFNSLEQVEGLSVITQTALGFIAFAIGNEFRVSQLKTMGKQAITVGILQAVITTIVVDIALIVLHLINPALLSLPSAITLGAIAAATAPAATLMVVRQYKADGPLTKLLLMVVAISVVSVILEPIIEIVISLVLGALSGLALNWLETYFHSRSKRLSLTVAFVLLMVGISSMEFELGGVKIGFSLLLVCMMTGTVFCNVCSASEELMSRLDRWTGPINILFFVLSGAELDLNILSNPLVLLIGIIYIVFRSIGKISGSYISCAMTKCSDHIKKHLGITLLPQAGVALGMALTATSLTDGSIVRNVVLFSVLVYELIGPSLTKRSLLAAGEIKPEGKTSAREENKPVKPITLK